MAKGPSPLHVNSGEFGVQGFCNEWKTMLYSQRQRMFIKYDFKIFGQLLTSQNIFSGPFKNYFMY